MANAILCATAGQGMVPESAPRSSTRFTQENRLMPKSRILLTCLLLATIAGAHGEVDAQEMSANVRLLAAARAGDMVASPGPSPTAQRPTPAAGWARPPW